MDSMLLSGLGSMSRAARMSSGVTTEVGRDDAQTVASSHQMQLAVLGLSGREFTLRTSPSACSVFSEVLSWAYAAPQGNGVVDL
jgi:hypothetical protein